jgi:hypothetical protein
MICKISTVWLVQLCLGLADRKGRTDGLAGRKKTSADGIIGRKEYR